ncbi:MAG: uroporphyrinogen decarboxylase [Rickettsiales bacterium]|nr:uroporphyrinogen decarboxylase [Rickettsiales bacterium]
MRQAGRYLEEYRKIRANYPSFLDFCYSIDDPIEVTLQPIRRYDMDAAILFSDILVIPDAMGQRTWFEKGEGPKLEAIQTEEQIDALNENQIHETLNPVYETLAGLKKSLPEDKTLIGFSGSPWTLACYMIEGSGSKDFAKTRGFAYENETLFESLISKLICAISSYCLRQIEAGADTIQLFDSWAGILPDDQFRRWVIEPTTQIVSSIKEKYPDTPIIGFARTAGVNLIDYVEQTKIQGAGIETSVCLKWAKENLSDKVVLQGNLDPILLASSKEKALEKTQEILDLMRDRPFIFNLGHGIVPHTPPEHVAAVSKLIKEYRP